MHAHRPAVLEVSGNVKMWGLGTLMVDMDLCDMRYRSQRDERCDVVRGPHAAPADKSEGVISWAQRSYGAGRKRRFQPGRNSGQLGRDSKTLQRPSRVRRQAADC